MARKDPCSILVICIRYEKGGKLLIVTTIPRKAKQRIDCECILLGTGLQLYIVKTILWRPIT